MDIDKFIKDKGLKLDCIVESDLDVKEYVQYEVRDLIKEALNEQLRLYIVSQQRELLIDFYSKQKGGMNETNKHAIIREVDNYIESINCG